MSRDQPEVQTRALLLLLLVFLCVCMHSASASPLHSRSLWCRWKPSKPLYFPLQPSSSQSFWSVCCLFLPSLLAPVGQYVFKLFQQTLPRSSSSLKRVSEGGAKQRQCLSQFLKTLPDRSKGITTIWEWIICYPFFLQQNTPKMQATVLAPTSELGEGNLSR